MSRNNKLKLFLEFNITLEACDMSVFKILTVYADQQEGVKRWSFLCALHLLRCVDGFIDKPC